MRELSLFTGAGGGLLGTKLLGWEHIGYVEINEYCQQLIRQRIDDGILDRAPIFTDVREFLESGAAEQYRGIADVVTAGFPCQPFSRSGKKLGEDDHRNMWPTTLNIIRAVRPRYALLENVPGILSDKYIRRIFGDLAESGFNARWDVLGTSSIGGDQPRKRVWIMADTKSIRPQSTIEKFRILQKATKNRARFTRDSGAFYSAECGRHLRETQPGVGRVAERSADRVDRIKAVGNGQDPRVVATAWKLLTNA